MNTNTAINISPSPLRVSATPREISLYDFSQEIQDDVRNWQSAMEMIAKDGRAGIASLVAMYRGVEGWSEPSLYRKFALWEASGRDWKVLLNKRPFHDLWARSERAAALPAEFVRWAGGQMLANQRKSKPAWRAIIRQWQLWRGGNAKAAIPGYASCPDIGPNGRHPLGWSYENLMERAQPAKAERLMARIGTAAAFAELPYVPGTRAGARYLEWIFFDDVWLDREVIVPGYLHPVRILQLGGMDYASGYYLHFGQRPDLPNDDDTRERLKRRDFLFLVAALLDRYGYPADYDMHLVLERGTATMSQAEARVLYDVSDGRIKVGYTGMNGRMVLAWDEKKSGKSSGKAVLESWHNLFHNEQANLPGQVGMDRDHCPAALFGQEREVVSLQKVGLLMPEAQRARLQMPLPSCDEAYLQTLEIVQRINGRWDHKCEGFGDVTQWRMPGARDWHEAHELTQATPEIMRALEFTTRKESPTERLHKLAQGVEIKRLPQNIWHRFYEDSHTLARVKRMQIEITLGGKTLFFGPENLETALPDGTEVLAYFAPNDPTVAYITHNGRYVDAWPRVNRIRRGDSDALREAIKRQQTAINITASRVRNKQAEELIRQERRIAGNEQIITESVPSVASVASVVSVERGAGALQEIGRRVAAGKQASDIDVVKTILDRPMKEEPAQEESWV